MTTSTVRLWDHEFTFLATEDCPDTAIKYGTNTIHVRHRGEGALLTAARQYLDAGLLARNVHITIDPNPNDLNRPGLDGDLGYATSVMEATV